MKMISRSLIFGLFLLSGVLGCNMPAILANTPTPGPTVTFTASPTPTPTLTPQPAMRIGDGEAALLRGDWVRALDTFGIAAQQSEDPDVWVAAQFGQARAYLEAGRPEDAVGILNGLIQTMPEHVRLGEAYLLRARAFEAQEQLDSAIQDYQAYLTAGDNLALRSYVQEWTGDALRRAGRPLDAVPVYEAALANPRAGSNLVLQIKIGHAYFEGGANEQALASFDAVYQSTEDAATRASMNLLAGRVLEAQGDLQGAHERYLDSVQNFPEAYDAYTGLITLVEANVPVDEYLRGYIDYQAGAYEPALAAFNRALEVESSAATHFYRGLTLRALSDPNGARSAFQIVIDSFPESPLWPQAWFEKAITEWAYLEQFEAALETYLGFVAAAPQDARAAEALFAGGQVAERNGDLVTAAQIWLRAAQEYPGDSLAHQAAFETGITEYRLGNLAPAKEAFLIAQNLATTPERRAAAGLWIGKVEDAMGEAEAASLSWTQAAASDPTGYYAERAGQLLRGEAPFSGLEGMNLDVDWQREQDEAEAWLRETFVIDGPEPLSAPDPGLASDPRLERAEGLWHLGMYELARLEFEALRAALNDDPEATYRLLHRLLDLGLYRSAIFASRNILDLAGFDDAGTLAAPIFFNHIRFGIYFEDLIFSQADQAGLDRLFVLSVVRQESLFEGFATSAAAARGLMQVIPSTGAEIATRLNWPPGYDDQDLYRPMVSVRFGIYYLTQQRDLFDGDLYAALAAYNAGPGNALIWHELAPDDPDLFLEIIRLSEPHLYIRRIYEFFMLYQHFYTVS